MKINIIPINKGEKRIWIKQTAKRKGHYRRIKTAEKLKWNAIVYKVVDYYESTIKDQDFESCGAFSINGDIIFQKDGEKDCVRFNESERIKCKGSVFTHNHPSGLSLSPEDVRWACQSEMKEMRYISRNGDKFIMKMKNGSNFNMDLWNEKIELTYSAMNNRIREKFINAINDGKMTTKEAEESHWDQVWRSVEKEIPEIEYNWEN